MTAADTAGGVYVGFQPGLAYDLGHVLRLDPGDETDQVVARIDGLPSDEVTLRDGELSIRYGDEVGRETILTACIGSTGAGSGTLQRCTENGCTEGRLDLLPLSSPSDEPNGYELLAEYRGSDWPPGATVDLQVQGNTAFVANGADGLRVLDVGEADQGRIDELSHLPAETDERWSDVKIYRNTWALVASSKRGLRFIDVTDPVHPQTVVDEFPAGRRSNGHNLFIANNRAYLARTGQGGGLTVVDVEEPSAPVELASFDLPNCRDVHDLFVDGEIAYIDCQDFGLVVADVSDPGDPKPIASSAKPRSHSSWVVNQPGRTLVLFSHEGFAGRLELAEFEQREPASLLPLGAFSLGSAASIHNYQCNPRRCWVAHYQEGLLEVDISNPTSPVLVAQLGTWDGPGQRLLEGASGVYVAPPLAYVADTERGLLVFRMPDSN